MEAEAEGAAEVVGRGEREARAVGGDADALAVAPRLGERAAVAPALREGGSVRVCTAGALLSGVREGLRVGGRAVAVARGVGRAERVDVPVRVEVRVRTRTAAMARPSDPAAPLNAPTARKEPEEEEQVVQHRSSVSVRNILFLRWRGYRRGPIRIVLVVVLLGCSSSSIVGLLLLPTTTSTSNSTRTFLLVVVPRPPCLFPPRLFQVGTMRRPCGACPTASLAPAWCRS
jgi:hypothetical protein